MSRFLTVVSKILGFIREASLAAVFGSTSDTDAYLVAQTIPYLLGATISYALTTAFIPVYSQMREERGAEEGSRFATSMIWAVLIVSVVLIGIGDLRRTTGPIRCTWIAGSSPNSLPT